MTFADLDNQLLLQGPALARLTDEEFYDLCQHNPTLRLERTADHNIIAMPPPVQNPAANQEKFTASFGCGIASTSWATCTSRQRALPCPMALSARPMRRG
ncbi:Uma2 family endonuclease [Hymenobacter sp. BRD128]|uniref:Uma2 family endonuclease n=1 Tax=Hymenobacter sp. BRD128 TaxID=2675878 RepID=UPI0020B8A13A|nr:Uma2 family endonuclease [Hymenobacter sp. BRD128]